MRSALLVFVLGIAGVVSSQTKSPQQGRQMTIQFLNVKTAKPLEGLSVIVTLENGNTGKVIPESSNIVAQVSLKTDKSGMVRVDVPVPYPDEVTVFAPALVDNVLLQFSIASVMQCGAIRRFSGNQPNKRTSVVANSGQILILNRKQTAWDRIKREFP